MDRFIQSLVCLCFLIVAGCGGDRLSSNSPATNQTAVDNLSALISAHPELAQAKLSKIKEASNVIRGTVAGNTNEGGQKKNVRHEQGALLYHSASSSEPVATAPDEGTAKESQSNQLDPEIAAKAQDLIDEALDKFDFQKDMNASIKITGIAINQAKEVMKGVQAMEKSFFGAKGDFSGGSKFDIEMKEMSCEEIVNNPFIKVPKAVFEQAEAQNRERIKATLAGCPKISASEFAQCLHDLNEIMSLIDEHATCEMQSTSDLEKAIAEATGKNLQKLARSVENCMREHFGKCGFTKKEINPRGQVNSGVS